VHDLLQELKTHKRIRKILAGGERLEWGAKTIPRVASCRCRSGCTRRAAARGDGVGLVNVPALKGIHYAVESGRLAAEAAWRRSSAARRRPPRRAPALRRLAPRQLRLEGPEARAEHAAGVHAAASGSAARSRRRDTPRSASCRRGQQLERDAEQDLITTDRAKYYPRRTAS
jgi:hypothetical protein